MSIFVDTSAIFTVLSADDSNHEQAKQEWSDLLTHEEELVSTNYVLVEAIALVQRRLGTEVVKIFETDIVSVLEIDWISEVRHRAAMRKMLVASNRQLSLVDFVSFDAMRRLGIKTAFAFDEDFARQGFECNPAH